MSSPNTKSLTVRKPLTNMDLLRVEGWAAQGLNTENIAVLLHMSPTEFRDLIRENDRLSESLSYGRTVGIQAVTRALYEAAVSGRDTGASRFYLERIGPVEFRPPTRAPIVVVEASRPLPDEADRLAIMELRFSRQRLLLEGKDIDVAGNIVEIEPARSPAIAKENPPPDSAEGG